MFTAKLPESNKVSQKSFSLSETNTSNFRGYKFKPRAIQNDHLKENWKTVRNRGSLFYTFEYNQFTTKN